MKIGKAVWDNRPLQRNKQPLTQTIQYLITPTSPNTCVCLGGTLTKLEAPHSTVFVCKFQGLINSIKAFN